MPDGAAILTTFEQTPVPSAPSTLRWVAAPNFWRYDRDDRVLYLPNGRVALYDSQGRLTWMRDAHSNVIDLSYEDDRLIVTQILSDHESRQVVFDMNPTTSLPTKMAYGGHEWRYRYLPGQPVRLERVEPPAGAPWMFEYEDPTSVLTGVTTPHAGIIRYTHDWQLFQTGENPQTDVEAAYVLQTRKVEGALIEPGTWRFDYGVLPGGAVSGMSVTLPSGVSVTYNYVFGDLPATPQVLSGAWMLAVRTVSPAGGGPPIEREELHYQNLRAARTDKPWGVPQISRRVTTRAGRSYTTEYQYSSNLTTFHDYHRPIRIREKGPGEQLNREVALTYKPVSGLVPFIAGLPETETVTASGRTVSRSWAYEPATGFRIRETQYGITTTFEDDDDGNVELARKQNDNWTRYSYRYGQVETVTSSEDGYGLTREVNPDGTIASETQAGRTTRYTYDALSRPVFVYPPGHPTHARETKTTYDSGTMTTERGSYKVVTTLDGFGRPVATESGDHQAGDTIKIRQRYDAVGRLTFTSLPYTGGGPAPGLRTCYDGLGRVVREEHLADHNHVDAPCGTASALAFRSYTYDDAADTVVVRDENGQTATRTYQAFGHPDDAQLVTLTDQAAAVWQYRYDVFGNLAEVRAPDGVTRTWAYNDKNLLQDETHPEWGGATDPQPGTVHYEYDTAGVLRSKRDARNQTILYAYDAADRLRQIDGPGTAIRIEYERGSDNRRLIAADGTESRLYYDPAGRLVVREDTIDGRPFVMQLEYDVHDNLTRVIYPTTARSIRYGHDRHNRVSHVVDERTNATLATDFRYHPSGALAGYLAGNGVETTIQHDPFRHWVTDVVVRPQGPATSLLHVAYRDPDLAGNIRRVRVSRNGETTADETFSYDAVGRLREMTGLLSQQFRYDVHGNRIGDAVGNDAFEYDARKRLTRFITVTMGYDNNGNLTSRAGDTFTYTATNWLRTVTAGGTATAYRYDADGLRLKKETAGAAPVYYTRDAQSRLLSEFVPGCPTGRTKQYVYAGAQLIAVMAADVNADDCDGDDDDDDGDDPWPGNRLGPNETLHAGQSRQSDQTRQYTLAYQEDGNLVLYHGLTDVWSTDTHALPAAGYVAMEADGRLIVVDAAGQLRWHSCTQGNPGAYLLVQDDGQLVIYSAAGAVLWDRFNNQTGAPTCQP